VKFQEEKNEENNRLENLWRKKARKLKEDSSKQEETYLGENNADCRPSHLEGLSCQFRLGEMFMPQFFK